MINTLLFVQGIYQNENIDKVFKAINNLNIDYDINGVKNVVPYEYEGRFVQYKNIKSTFSTLKSFSNTIYCIKFF